MPPEEPLDMVMFDLPPYSTVTLASYLTGNKIYVNILVRVLRHVSSSSKIVYVITSRRFAYKTGTLRMRQCITL